MFPIPLPPYFLYLQNEHVLAALVGGGLSVLFGTLFLIEGAMGYFKNKEGEKYKIQLGIILAVFGITAVFLGLYIWIPAICIIFAYAIHIFVTAVQTVFGK